MKKYIITRLIKSVISIFVVVSIVIVMLYTLIPTSKLFQKDDAYRKLSGNAKITYQYNKLEELDYLDFVNLNDMCIEFGGDYDACMITGTEENISAIKSFEEKGYTSDIYKVEEGVPATNFAYRYFSPLELLYQFYSGLLFFDTPNYVEDPNNPDLERGYSLGSTPSGSPALLCSGCKYKYQVYVDGNFPFIHQNFFALDFGDSYPTNSGINTLDVIGGGQGAFVSSEQTFPTGLVQESPINQLSCEYKHNLDHLDTKKFTDNYADCALEFDSPSMIETSYIINGIAVVIAYIIAVPFAVMAARKRGKFLDKFSVVYVNLLIALPSLAFIFIMKYFGTYFGLPDKFPQFGYFDFRSYVLPIIILALLSTPNIMVWLKRFMIDQSNADYVKFAKAKGLSNSEIYQKHIFKNAIIPVVNGIPAAIILAISGAVITESVFAIPGMGKMLPDSITAVNNNMIITITFIFTSLSVLAIFLGDLLMTIVDPRIQLAKKENE